MEKCLLYRKKDEKKAIKDKPQTIRYDLEERGVIGKETVIGAVCRSCGHTYIESHVFMVEDRGKGEGRKHWVLRKDRQQNFKRTKANLVKDVASYY